MIFRKYTSLLLLILFFLTPAVLFAADTTSESLYPWYLWAILLFFFTLALGIFAVIGGVGGGVLFVPLVGAFFPFHLNYVRGAGLLVALCGALSAAPTLLKKRMASLSLALPLSLVGSIGSIAGATVGLALPDALIQLLLGILILGIVTLMILSRKKSNTPEQGGGDVLSKALGMGGIFYDPSLEKEVKWEAKNTLLGIFLFIGIGFLAGMFGLGAGWANVPVLNLLLGTPLKVAVATSGLILSINDTAAAWVYLNQGAVLPLIAIPSVAGMMIGARIGARLLPYVKPDKVKIGVIIILLAAGGRAFYDGIMALTGGS